MTMIVGAAPPAVVSRLAAAADEVEELAEALVLARSRRDDLIVAALDEGGLSYQQIARCTKLSRARIIAIIARTG